MGVTFHELAVERKLSEQNAILKKQLKTLREQNPAYVTSTRRSSSGVSGVKSFFNGFAVGILFTLVAQIVGAYYLYF